MILSRKFKFIFIKNVKVAGTSVEIFLSNLCAEDDVVTPIYPIEGGHQARNFVKDGVKLFNHMSCKELRRLFPAEFDGYFKFCIERNPWDKVVSEYFMQLHRKNVATFEEYLSERMLPLNLPRYTDESGAVLVDRVIRYETLDSELADVFDSLGIPFGGDLGIRAKNYRPAGVGYREFYTPQTREFIREVFAREIDLFGYEF